MLHLIPAPLHRAGLRLAHAVRKRWWRLARVQLNGCRVLALDQRGGVLLIRHSYGSGKWMLPGGGIDRGEAPLAAALRELREEVALTLSNPREVEVIEKPLYGTTSRVHLFAGRAEGEPRCDGREIIEARFFMPGAWPDRMAPTLEEEIARWLAVFGD